MNVVRNVKAIIFDCDGVIADTERAHYAAFAEALSGFGVKLTWKDYCARYLAMDDEGCIRETLKNRVQSSEFRVQNNNAKLVKKIKTAKAKLYWQYLRDGHFKIYPGVKNFVKRMASQGYPLAIASGSSRREVKFILKFNSLQPYFKVIVAAEDVINGKPHPEAYKRALTGLNGRKGKIQPSQCLVIEDSIHGVQSAKRAGMKCLAVANTYPVKKLLAAGADLVVSSLRA